MVFGLIGPAKSDRGGLIDGINIAKAVQEQRNRQALQDAMGKVANGDESGWKDVAAVAPDVYLKHQNQEWERQHGNDITPYQQAMLDLRREELTQNALNRQANEEARKQAEADALEKQQEEEQKSVDNAQAGVNAMQAVADRGNLTRFQDSWWNKWDKDIQRDQGELASAIAAVAPRAIAKLKAAGVSGVNTLGEFMTYVGLPQNATDQQIAAAVPLISKIIGVEQPKSNKEKPSKEEAIAELKRRGRM